MPNYITNEQRDALASSEDPCIHLHDPETNKVYVLIEQGVEPEFEQAHLEYMRAGLKQAAEQVVRGEVEPWDKSAIRSAGQQRLDQP